MIQDAGAMYDKYVASSPMHPANQEDLVVVTGYICPNQFSDPDYLKGDGFDKEAAIEDVRETAKAIARLTGKPVTISTYGENGFEGDDEVCRG